ncbi:hypothetical protein L208DRAFT_1412503 [Tricholoma matsutake]|nr:hypothetical protein L208DRAFT_1412503 [Tricholoma matsutake 945]
MGSRGKEAFCRPLHHSKLFHISSFTIHAELHSKPPLLMPSRSGANHRQFLA